MLHIAALPSLEALRQHVLVTLCQHDNLDPAQTPLHQTLITRRGKTCGIFFELQGPRLLKTYAVWAGEEDRILFYDTAGERFAESRLSDAPDPLLAAA
jgi:hypothetical protein